MFADPLNWLCFRAVAAIYDRRPPELALFSRQFLTNLLILSDMLALFPPNLPPFATFRALRPAVPTFARLAGV